MKIVTSFPKKLLVVVGLVGFVAGCSRESESPVPNQNEEQELGEREVAVLDSLPHVNLTPEDVELANGQSLKSYIAEHDTGQFQHRGTAAPIMSLTQRKTEVLAQMASRAWELTQDKIYKAGLQPDEPEQKSGLGYVYGSSGITSRSRSTYGNTPCSQKLYGLDCSGYVNLVASAAHVNIGPGSEKQSVSDNWKKALKAAYPVEFANVQVVELPGSTTSDKLVAGDVVIFNRGKRINHTGIIFKDKRNGELVLFNSYGKGDENCEKNYNYYTSTWQPYNQIKRGPTQISLAVIPYHQNITNFLGGGTTMSKILRIKGENEVHEVAPKNHTAQVLQSLPDSIAVLVADENGKPIVGKQVQFTVSSGQVSAQSRPTNAKGQAKISWTLGANPGSQTLTATAVIGLSSNPTVTIPATAIATNGGSCLPSSNATIQLLSGGSSKTWYLSGVIANAPSKGMVYSCLNLTVNSPPVPIGNAVSLSLSSSNQVLSRDFDINPNGCNVDVNLFLYSDFYCLQSPTSILFYFKACPNANYPGTYIIDELSSTTLKLRYVFAANNEYLQYIYH